tara:strand:- start:322 stop:537 length:216 start_codon:yes stop_codon:yes gene_type:complete
MKTKKVKKKNDTEYGHNDNSNCVYMFHNIKTNVHLFINAFDLESAMVQFDLCNFSFRSDWKIFLETGQQPA